MTYFAVKVWQPVKQTVAPKESCLYVFDQCFHSYFIFLNSKDIFLAYKQLTCLQKLYLTSKNPLKNILLSENKSSRQKPPTPNFECLELQPTVSVKSLRSMHNSNCSGIQGWAKKKTFNLLHGYMKLNCIIWQFSSRSDDLHVPVTKKYSSLQCWFLHHMSVRHLERDFYEGSGFYLRNVWGTTGHPPVLDFCL